MKSRILWVIVTITITIFSNCKKKSTLKEVIETFECGVEVIEGEQHEIVGKWKLVLVGYAFSTPDPTDYSCNQIVYDFKPDGRLVVTSDIAQTGGYGAGNYSYEFNRRTASTGNPNDYTLSVGEGSTWPVSVGRCEMVLSFTGMATDGAVLRFIRIG